MATATATSVPSKPFDRPAGRSKRQFDLPAAGQIDSAAAQNDLCVEQESYCIFLKFIGR